LRKSGVRKDFFFLILELTLMNIDLDLNHYFSASNQHLSMWVRQLRKVCLLWIWLDKDLHLRRITFRDSLIFKEMKTADVEEDASVTASCGWHKERSSHLFRCVCLLPTGIILCFVCIRRTFVTSQFVNL